MATRQRQREFDHPQPAAVSSGEGSGNLEAAEHNWEAADDLIANALSNNSIQYLSQVYQSPGQ